MKKILLMNIMAIMIIIKVSAQSPIEFEKLIMDSLADKNIVIWEDSEYFKDLEIQKYYQLERLENIVLRKVYNSMHNRYDNTIETDFIFKRENAIRTVKRRFVYNNISLWDAKAIDEGMRIGNYGLEPYLYIKTGRLESGFAAWGSFFNFYYGKSIWRPYTKWINLDVKANSTVFLIWDKSLIKAWNVFIGREVNKLRSQIELEDLLTIPPVVRPKEIREGEIIALYWDECYIIDKKEDNGKYIYLICVNNRTDENVYRRILLETGREPRGNLMTMEIIYVQYIGNDREGRMRFREVENWF